MAIQEVAPCGLEKPITKQRITEQKGNKHNADNRNRKKTKNKTSLNPKLKPGLVRKERTQLGAEGEEGKRNRVRQGGRREKREGMEKATREDKKKMYEVM